MLGCIAQTVGPFIKERAVDLVRVAQQHDLRIFPCSGDNALDLIRRGILRLVNDQVGLDDGTAPYIIKRFCLNDSPRKYLFDLSTQLFLILIALLLTGIDKLLQIIDNRAHKRRDLLLFIAGQVG